MARRLSFLQVAAVAGRFGPGLGPSAALLVLLLAFLPAVASDGPPYRSSVVGTDFDFITESDPDTFVRLENKGRGQAEMPDKSDRSAPLVQPAFLFVAHFNDGTRVKLAIDVDFQTQDLARTEALRYTPRLGRLPTALRRGVDRVVVHKGGENVTAFSDIGLIVLYSDSATTRIGTHDRRRGGGTQWRTDVRGFLGVDNVREMEELVRKTLLS